MKSLKTVRQAAAECGLSYRILLEAVENGEVRTVRLGKRPLLPEGAVDDFLRAKTYEPVACDRAERRT